MTAENNSLVITQLEERRSRGAFGTALKRVGVAALAVGLVGGLALPAVAMNGEDSGSAALASLYAGKEQSFEISPELEAALALVPDQIEATTPEELQAIRDRAEEEARRDREAVERANAEAAATASSQPNSSQQSTPAPPPISAEAGGIIGTAQSMLGVPYVFGGATPAGFDCSGFTQWVFAQHGISLPRIAGAQASVGAPVAIADAQPGDLAVWGGHTGIYVGNDTMIHSPTTGKTVSYVSFSGMVRAMGTPQIRRF